VGAGNMVDFNRDGIFRDSSAGGNREATTMANFCTWAIRNMDNLTADDTGACNASLSWTSPKMIRIANRLYVFYVSLTDHKIHYYQGVESGNDPNGGCPGGSTFGAKCMTWSRDAVIPATTFTVQSFSAIAPPSGSSVLFVYRDASGNMRGFNGSIVDGFGNLGGFSGETNIDIGVTIDPELATTYVDAGGSPLIGLYYLTNAGYRWKTASAPGAAWVDRGAVVDASGASLTGDIGASVASTSNRTCAVFPDASRKARFHCLDVTSGRWTDYSTTMFASTGSYLTQTVKPSLAFHRQRDKNGNPLYGEPSIGQFWMATVSPGATARSLLFYTSSALSSAVLPDASMHFTFYAWGGSYWDDVYPGSGVSLFADGSVSALKAAILGPSGPSTGCVMFLPLVDGTVNETQTDINDFQVMERGMCLGLHGGDTAYCGATNNFGY
jgi:hypothetical protein